MSVKQIVKKLTEEIKKGNRKEVVETYEDLLCENIEKLSKNENFFNLPLKNIFSVVSKVDFNLIEENDKIIEIIQNIIKNLVQKHFEEKETILILQNLNLTTNSFSSYEEIFSLLALITNFPILVNFCNSYKEQIQFIDKDYEYEIQQKEQEIEKLKQKIKSQSSKDFWGPKTQLIEKDYEYEIQEKDKEIKALKQKIESLQKQDKSSINSSSTKKPKVPKPPHLLSPMKKIPIYIRDIPKDADILSESSSSSSNIVPDFLKYRRPIKLMPFNDDSDSDVNNMEPDQLKATPKKIK